MTRGLEDAIRGFLSYSPLSGDLPRLSPDLGSSHLCIGSGIIHNLPPYSVGTCMEPSGANAFMNKSEWGS